MKILTKSVDMAMSLFPASSAGRRQSYHFSFIWERNNLLAIGQNANRIDAKTMYFAKRFNISRFRQYPYLHAEVDAISKLWGRIYIDNRLKLVSLRVNTLGVLCNSQPCVGCSAVLNGLDISKIWYSNSEGKIVQ